MLCADSQAVSGWLLCQLIVLIQHARSLSLCPLMRFKQQQTLSLGCGAAL